MLDDFEMKRMIYSYIKEICHYSQMQVFATSYYQSNYFQLQIDEAAGELTDSFIQYKQELLHKQELIHQQDQKQQPENQEEKAGEVRSFTQEELAAFDGANGRNAYVAVNGTVYDMTNEIRWAGGTHFGMNSGHDLSKEFRGCHQGMQQILSKLPIVGKIEQVES